ncbi:MAG: Imm70 family immunity protein [Terrimicrobiaceae bacterium]
MGLYLCIFDGDEELDGVEVGSYADYNALRDYIIRELEMGQPGFLFPIFVLHSDCDGEWSVADCELLRSELSEIEKKLKKLPMIEFTSEWQKTVAKDIGLVPKNAFESFIDIDGEFLVERLKNLTDKAMKHSQPILFQ